MNADRGLGRASVLAVGWWIGLGGLVGGCADPCFDDGLAQGGCPETPADGTAGSATRGTEDGTADATRGATTAVADSTADSAADSTTGAASASGDGAGCPELEEVLLPQTPTFQLILDQSGSMDEDFDNGETRWEAMRSTLVGPDGVVTALQSSIRFGLSLYRNPQGGMCPDVRSLLPQLDAADEITTLLDMEQPGGDTPTGESFQLISDELLTDRWKGDKVIVLATDGEPDTCAIPEPADQAETDMVRAVAVDAVAAAFDDGISTFVVSVGDQVAQEHLQDLANAGAGQQPGDPDAPFYVANDTASLVDAFDTIVAGLRPCTFTLSAPLMAALAPSCEVTINDDVVPYDDPDGWGLPDPDTLELQGDACASIQQGAVSIKLACSCDD